MVYEMDMTYMHYLEDKYGGGLNGATDLEMQKLRESLGITAEPHREKVLNADELRKKRKILKLWEKGYLQNEIAKKTHIAQSRVSDTVRTSGIEKRPIFLWRVVNVKNGLVVYAPTLACLGAAFCFSKGIVRHKLAKKFQKEGWKLEKTRAIVKWYRIPNGCLYTVANEFNDIYIKKDNTSFKKYVFQGDLDEFTTKH